MANLQSDDASLEGLELVCVFREVCQEGGLQVSMGCPWLICPTPLPSAGRPWRVEVLTYSCRPLTFSKAAAWALRPPSPASQKRVGEQATTVRSPRHPDLTGKDDVQLAVGSEAELLNLLRVQHMMDFLVCAQGEEVARRGGVASSRVR